MEAETRSDSSPKGGFTACPYINSKFLQCDVLCPTLIEQQTFIYSDISFWSILGVPDTSVVNWRVSIMAQNNEDSVYKHSYRNASVIYWSHLNIFLVTAG
jgi:hypothetical protein